MNLLKQLTERNKMTDFKIELLDADFVEFYTGYDVPDEQKGDFDYLDSEEFLSNNFVKINDQFYDLSDFMRLDESTEYKGFHGIVGQSYFHAYLIMLSDCGTCYKIAKLTT